MQAGLQPQVPLAETYFQTGLVPRLPTAVLAIGLIVIGVLSCLVGLILDVATMRSELMRLAYLSYPPIPSRTSSGRPLETVLDARDGEGSNGVLPSRRRNSSRVGG